MPTGNFAACPTEAAANTLSVLGQADWAVLIGLLSLILSLLLSCVTLVRARRKR